MIEIIWEFHIHPSRVAEFERNYGSDGAWAVLFRESKNYHGTILLKDSELTQRYITIDKWEKLEDFENFQLEFQKAYSELDSLCENLTVSEKMLGIFQVIHR